MMDTSKFPKMIEPLLFKLVALNYKISENHQLTNSEFEDIKIIGDVVKHYNNIIGGEDDYYSGFSDYSDNSDENKIDPKKEEKKEEKEVKKEEKQEEKKEEKQEEKKEDENPKEITYEDDPQLIEICKK
jgi:hypothetical protein